MRGIRFPRPKRTPPPSLYTLCFVRKDAEVLLQFRRRPPNAGYWNCPGGKIEPGESPTEACIREVWEETGLQLINPRLRAVVTMPSGIEEKSEVHMFVYEATEFTGETRSSQEGMIDWLPEKHLAREPELAPDIPILLRALDQSSQVITARLTTSGRDSRGWRLIPDNPALA